MCRTIVPACELIIPSYTDALAWDLFLEDSQSLLLNPTWIENATFRFNKLREAMALSGVDFPALETQAFASLDR